MLQISRTPCYPCFIWMFIIFGNKNHWTKERFVAKKALRNILANFCSCTTLCYFIHHMSLTLNCLYKGVYSFAVVIGFCLFYYSVERFLMWKWLVITSNNLVDLTCVPKFKWKNCRISKVYSAGIASLMMTCECILLVWTWNSKS